MPDKEVEDTLLKLLEPCSESFIDDVAVLVGKTPKKKLGETQCANRASFDCNRSGRTLKTKRSTKLRQRKPAIPTPKGDHNVFTYLPKDPNCEVYQMTKTARATCKTGPLKRAGGISLPTSLGALLTSDHKIFNLDSGSRNDHLNALIVQDRDSYWLQTNPTTSRHAQETASCFVEILASTPRGRRDLHRQLQGVHQNV